jgi:glycine/D-amino acid oxidase-like deaminating enzyme
MGARVVVVGAGIVGTALAVRLAEAGARVSLVDGQEPGTGTTATSMAWLNANRKEPRGYFELNTAAMAGWERLAAAFADPPWYAPTGHLTWARGDGAGAELVARVERLRSWGYAADLVTGAEAAALEPAVAVPAGATAAFFPGEGFLHGRQAAAALAHRAAELGADLVTGVPVHGFTAANGRLTGVRLGSGPVLPADAVVCCAGWRSNELLAGLGVRLALVPADEPGSAAPCLITDTAAVRDRPRRVVSTGGVFVRPAWDGGLRLEADEADGAVGLTAPDGLRELAGQALRAATALLPALAGAAVLGAYRCVRPLPVDGYPVAGWHRDAPGLYVLVTHSGMTLAPELAVLAAAEILGGEPAAALAPYRPDRFAGAA